MTALPTSTANHIKTINTSFDILTEWAEATTRLHENHNRLVACINLPHTHQKTSAISGCSYIGQCPVDQITGLLMIMQEQMERLVIDMEQISFPNRPVTTENYKKLAMHTRVINKLNQQAQTKLLLTTLSTV